jgi:hypothetical protein
MSMSRRARTGAWVAAALLGGGLAAGVVMSQLGVATAASAPSPGPGATTAPRGPWAGMHGMRGPMDRLARVGGRVLHGEATVRTPQGKDEVVEFQTGTLTAVKGSVVTVKSADGFTADYTVDKTTRIVLNGTNGALSTLKTNDQVRVLAVKSGSTAVAKSLVDGQGEPPFGGRFMRRGGAAPNGPATGADLFPMGPATMTAA